MAPAPLAGRSIRIAGSCSRVDPAEGFGDVRGVASPSAGALAAPPSMVSVTRQLNGGSFSAMLAVTSSATDSRMKRFQLMLTSQVA